VLPAVVVQVRPGAPIAAMAKPQFEADRATATRYGGVIPVGKPRDEVLAELRGWLKSKFVIAGEADSAVAGTQGNVERFFLLAQPPK